MSGPRDLCWVGGGCRVTKSAGHGPPERVAAGLWPAETGNAGLPWLGGPHPLRESGDT